MVGKMDSFGLTDIGRKRTVNEDQFLVADLNKSMRVDQTSLGLDHQTRLFGNSQGTLLAVADGLGGHEAGERASQLVVDSVVTYVLNTLQWFFHLNAESDEDFRDELKESLRHCQAMLQRDAEATPQHRGMGTTMTMAYVIWPRMYVVHVGDSRCYLFRDSQLKQITRDHTMAQLVKESHEEQSTPEVDEDEMARWNNTLWNVISADDAELRPEVNMVNLKSGDTVLLCTDGLTKHVEAPRLKEVLNSDVSAEAMCKRLVDEANELGGSDNITVVISQFQDADGDLFSDESEAELPMEESAPDPLADTVTYIEESDAPAP